MATVELLASDVVIVEREPEISTFPEIPTAVLGIVGITERGPFGGTLVQSFEQYVEKFGGFTANADAAVAAMGFFAEGGATAWIVRTVHYTTITDATSKTSAAATVNITTTGAATQGSVTSGNVEPFFFVAAGTIIVKVDGGATQTATFDATAGSRTGVAGTYPTGFGGGETLTLIIDGSGVTRTVTFSAAATTLAVVVNEVNEQLPGAYAEDSGGQLKITSDRLGTGSSVSVTGGTGAATLGMAVAATSGTGDVSNIEAVTAAEIKSLVEADTTATVTVETTGAVTIKTPTVGAAGSIQVDATSTLDSASYADLDNVVHAGTAAGPGTMGTASGKTDGAWANSWIARVGDASNGDSDYFNLSVVDSNGTIKEVFVDLITTVADADYWLTKLNDSDTGSIYLTFTDSLTGTPPANRPTNGDYTLASGDDGLTSIADTDFIGNVAGPTGLYELDKVENINLLAVPNKATSAIHNAMITYCEGRDKQIHAILDPPTSQTAAQMVTYTVTTASLKGASDAASIYWPRIKVQNPDATVYTSDDDGNVTVAPSGFIAGAMARNDNREPGIYQAAAGIDRGKILSARGLETDEAKEKAARGLVYTNYINPITTQTGAGGYFIDGTKTLKLSAQFPRIGQRRGASHIEQQIRQGVAFARHLNITKKLRRRVDKTIRLFLLGEMRKGAFATENPDTAFFVNVGDKINPPSESAAGRLNVRIGLAFADPADWVIINIGKDTRALDAELAAAGAL